MHVDHLTLACLRDGLDALLGAHVQRVVLPDPRSVGLELYAGVRFQVLISANTQHPRMLLIPHKVRRGVEGATPLLLLLRKWVAGSRLVDVTQPAWERIVTLHFDGRAGRCRLIAELIGRYSNLILVDRDGVVMEAVKHVGPDINRYRVTLPAHPYQPPPKPPGRRPPTSVSAQEWGSLLYSVEGDRPLHRVLTSQLFGVSPTAGREIAARVLGDPEGAAREAPPREVCQALSKLFAPLEDGTWDPHIALGESGQVLAFAPYKLSQFEDVQSVPTIDEAMWRYFEARMTADAYASARGRVQELLDRARSAREHALDQVRRQQVDEEELKALREAGELLLAYQHLVHPGAEEVTVPDYAGRPRSIELDSGLGAVENAQAIFKRYRKAQRAAEEIPARIRALEADLAYLDHLEADLSLAEIRPQIDAVHVALADAGWAPGKPRHSSGDMAKRPRRFDVGDYPVFVGRNAAQNDQVTFERGSAEDLWLHVRGMPGSHVIIKTAGRRVPEDVVRQAAALAAHYSSARDSARVDVDVTERRFVKRAPGSRPGMVNYRNERTLAVEPRPLSSEG